jgi:hypothetical protein
VLDNRSTSIFKASGPPTRSTWRTPSILWEGAIIYPLSSEAQISSRTSTLRQHLSLISKARKDSIHVLNSTKANSCNQTPRSTLSLSLFLIYCIITSIPHFPLILHWTVHRIYSGHQSPLRPMNLLIPFRKRSNLRCPYYTLFQSFFRNFAPARYIFLIAVKSGTDTSPKLEGTSLPCFAPRAIMVRCMSPSQECLRSRSGERGPDKGPRIVDRGELNRR